MNPKINTILLIVLGLVIIFTLGAIYNEKYGISAKLIERQQKLINRQHDLIDMLENENDSLQITRSEFDNAVRLLESKK